MCSLFGCVIDTLGCQDGFIAVADSTLALEVPSPWLMSYISVFVKDPTTLAGGAAQVIFEAGGAAETLGFLTDFRPSLTAPAPRHLVAGAAPGAREAAVARLIIQATDLESVVQKDVYQPSVEECNMVDYQAWRLVSHFNDAIQKYAITDSNARAFVPLSQVEAWAERYKKYLQYNY